MENKVQISVILPCYKVEIFLPTVIACLEKQTFRDFEIILVNDGGSARQLQIMRDLQAQNEKIRIIDKPNGGAASARNAGIDASLGEWLVFVDPDDEADPFYLESLYAAATMNQADITIAGYKQHYVWEKRFVEHFITNTKNIYSKQEVYEMLDDLTMGVPWNKIFKAEFLRQNHFYFPVSIPFADDRGFIDFIYIKSNPRITFVRNCGYIYKMRDAESVLSSYCATYAQSNLQLLSLTKQLLEQFTWDEDRKTKYLTHNTYLMGIGICYNNFKRNTPLTFRQQIQAIRSDILQNSEIMLATKNESRKGQYLYQKIYNTVIKTQSPLIIVIVYRCIYGFKYHFYSLHLKIKSFYLRRIN
jgi:glycosyltransferase involved in cell wall biosynthesis